MKSTTVSSRVGVCAAVALSLVLVGCSGDDGRQAEPAGADNNAPQELTEVSYGLPSSSIAGYGLFAADALGYYADEGIEVNFITTDGSASVVQQMVAENLDMGMGTTDAFLVGMEQYDLYPFFVYFTREFRDWIVPADGGIASIEDVKGTKIGVTALEGGEVPLVRYLLTEAGIDPAEDVEILAVGEAPATILSSLEQGRIDTFAGSVSHIVSMQSQGFEPRSLLPEIYRAGPVEGIVARPPHHENEELLIGMGRATAKGLLFCQTNVDACLEVIADTRPELVEDPELARENIERYIEFSLPPTEDGEMAFSPLSVEGWENYLGIFSQGDDAPISDPEAIDLERLVLDDLRGAINDFDHAAVIEEAENY